MSIDLIGNGNFPCVYTKNINIDETAGESNEGILEVQCSIYDFVNSNGDLMWTEKKEFLTNEIYLYSVVVQNISQVSDIQSVLIETLEASNVTNSGPLSIKRKRLRHIVNLEFESSQNTPQTPELNSIGLPTAVITPYGLAFELPDPLEIPSGLGQLLGPMRNNESVEYGFKFTHICDLSGDVHVISFIAYDIEKDAGTNIMRSKNKFFIGPMLIDTVKEFTNTNSNYVLQSELYFKNAQIYKGSFHKMTGNKTMSGVLHDDNSVELGVENNGYNPKLTILRDYDNIYQEQDLSPKPPPNAGEVISKPLVSINDDIVTCYFKFQADFFHTNSSQIAQYNYYKIVDNISAEVYIPYTNEGRTKLETTKPLRHIKINHPNVDSKDLFFEIAAKIPQELRIGPESIQLKMDFNFQEILGAERLNSFFTNPIQNIISNFLNTNSETSYKGFIKNFVIALSLKYEMNGTQVADETRMLLNSFQSNFPYSYKTKLANTFQNIYYDLMSKFEAQAAIAFVDTYAVTVPEINLSNFENGKAPKYFPDDTRPSVFLPQFMYVFEPNYMNILHLQRRLEDENRRIFGEGLILQGTQQLMPYSILNEIKPKIQNIFELDITDNSLDYYKTNENPGLIYLDPNPTNIIEVDSPQVFVTDEEQAIEFEVQFQQFDFNAVQYQTRTFFTYN